MAEAFRSGLETVAAIQTESALSLGMSRLQVMRYVVLPRAFFNKCTGLYGKCNLSFERNESVFSAVSLMDLMFTAKRLNRTLLQDNRKPVFLLVVFYLLILLQFRYWEVSWKRSCVMPDLGS